MLGMRIFSEVADSTRVKDGLHLTLLQGLAAVIPLIGDDIGYTEF